MMYVGTQYRCSCQRLRAGRSMKGFSEIARIGQECRPGAGTEREREREKERERERESRHTLSCRPAVLKSIMLSCVCVCVVCKGDVMSYPVTTHTHTHTHIKVAGKGGGGQGGEGGGGGFGQRVYCRRVLFNGGFQTSPPPFPKNKPCS